MDSSLRLIAATPDMTDALTSALREHGIAFRNEGNLVMVEGDGAPERVVGQLRQFLSGAGREGVSVVEEMAYPDEFPVTTRLDAWWWVFATAWFEKAMAANAFAVWFQPVVDTTARRTIGHECLIRMTRGHRREGAEIMAAGTAHRDMGEFDAYVRKLSIRAAAAQRAPDGDSVCFLNFIPACGVGETMELLQQAGIKPGNIVMEAVESNHHADVTQLKNIGDYLREQGMGFALDDVEADADSVRMISELRPDYIKLDKHLVHRIEHPAEAAAVRRLVEVAERLGVRVVAKGVERVPTMEHLWMAGIRYMQGYLFGSPAPEITRAGAPMADGYSEWDNAGIPAGLLTASVT